MLHILTITVKADLLSANVSRATDAIRRRMFFFKISPWGERDVLFTRQICSFHEPEAVTEMCSTK